jgi:hypothetical protein
VAGFAGPFLALARAASTIFTPIRQGNVLANGGGQNGFIGFNVKSAATGLNGDLECHTLSGLSGKGRT